MTRPMMQWQPISTAPYDRPVLLGCIHKGQCVYAVMAEYGTAMPGYIQCASYSGWFVDGIPLLTDPIKSGVHLTTMHGVLSRTDYAPTHWAELPEIAP